MSPYFVHVEWGFGIPYLCSEGQNWMKEFSVLLLFLFNSGRWCGNQPLDISMLREKPNFLFWRKTDLTPNRIYLLDQAGAVLSWQIILVCVCISKWKKIKILKEANKQRKSCPNSCPAPGAGLSHWVNPPATQHRARTALVQTHTSNTCYHSSGWEWRKGLYKSAQSLRCCQLKNVKSWSQYFNFGFLKKVSLGKV